MQLSKSEKKTKKTKKTKKSKKSKKKLKKQKKFVNSQGLENTKFKTNNCSLTHNYTIVNYVYKKKKTSTVPFTRHTVLVAQSA